MLKTGSQQRKTKVLKQFQANILDDRRPRSISSPYSSRLCKIVVSIRFECYYGKQIIKLNRLTQLSFDVLFVVLSMINITVNELARPPALNSKKRIQNNEKDGPNMTYLQPSLLEIDKNIATAMIAVKHRFSRKPGFHV